MIQMYYVFNKYFYMIADLSSRSAPIKSWMWYSMPNLAAFGSLFISRSWAQTIAIQSQFEVNQSINQSIRKIFNVSRI